MIFLTRLLTQNSGSDAMNIQNNDLAKNITILVSEKVFLVCVFFGGFVGMFSLIRITITMQHFTDVSEKWL